MRKWAQWCVDHNLKIFLYLAATFVQLPIYLTVYVYNGIVDAFKELIDDYKSIHKAQEHNGF